MKAKIASFLILGIVPGCSASQGGELDDLTCSSPAILKIVRKLATQEFDQKVGGVNKLYAAFGAIRTQSPGLCLLNYEYRFGPPRGYHNQRSRGDYKDWWGDTAEVVYDFQITDDKKEVVVHAFGFNFQQAHFGFLRPEEQRADQP